MELRDQVAAGKTTILIPIGGTEQNGPHMVLGKHNARARVLSQRIAQKLGNALVAPVIAYTPEGSIDPPTQHMKFAGTISIPEDVFEKTLEAAAKSFRAHGFKDIVLLGDHGGYQKSLRRVADLLNKQWAGKGVRAHHIEEYYRAADSAFAKALRTQGFGVPEIGEHAGLADTAITLDVDATLVRAERLASSAKDPESGVRGDPARATAELGRKGTQLIVDASVEAIRKATARR